jgi:hypothetical protein
LKVEAARGQASAFGVHKWQQGHDSGTLDCVSEITLLFGGEASEATRQNLAALGDELLEEIDVFVVNRVARLDRRKALFEKRAGHGKRRRQVNEAGYDQYLKDRAKIKLKLL